MNSTTNLLSTIGTRPGSAFELAQLANAGWCSKSLTHYRSSDLDYCNHPAALSLIPYPTSRPPILPAYEQFDTVLIFENIYRIPFKDVLAVIAGLTGGAVVEFFLAGPLVSLGHLAGNGDAADLLGHWLSGTGTTRFLPVERMFREIGGLQGDASTRLFNGWLMSRVNNEVSQGIQNPGNSCFSFSILPETQTDWGRYDPPSGNWYFALGSFWYAMGANVMVTRQPGGSWNVDMCYRVFVYDTYDWQPTSGFVDKVAGWAEMTQYAKRFEVIGISEPICISYPYPNIQNPVFLPPTASVS